MIRVFFFGLTNRVDSIRLLKSLKDYYLSLIVHENIENLDEKSIDIDQEVFDLKFIKKEKNLRN